MIPYDDITETADRSWTSRLLDRLAAADLPDDEMDDLVGALQAVSDPRSVGPLEAVVCDAARPAGIREAASSALRGMQYLVPDVPEGTLRRWWREGDAVLRRHALLWMDAFDCPDVVLTVASDPGHPFHAEALGQMTFYFDLPGHEAIKVAALAHPDPRVRETAATILFWDEPVRAEGPLIEAARDPVPEVVAEVCKTLEYYPSLKTVRCLYRLLDHPAEKVRQEAEVSFADVRHEFLLGLRSRDPRVATHVRSWLKPVWDVLAFTEDEFRPGDDPARTPSPPDLGEVLPLENLLGMLRDPDTSPKALRESLWRNDWRGYAADERTRLRAMLLEHPDPLVREEAAVACGAWQDADGLLALVRDADFGVRKTTMCRLIDLPPTPGVANLAWEHLHRPDALGFHARETLDTFVKHADPAVALRRLGWIAGDHGRREGLRTAAVYHLARLRAVEQLAQFAGLLLEPPEVTWSLHIALLGSADDLGLPVPDNGPLRGVDNLHVQEAIARLGA
jgi:hypothetical protein